MKTVYIVNRTDSNNENLGLVVCETLEVARKAKDMFVEMDIADLSGIYDVEPTLEKHDDTTIIKFDDEDIVFRITEYNLMPDNCKCISNFYVPLYNQVS